MNVTFTEWNPVAVIQMAKRMSRKNLEKASQLLIDKIKDAKMVNGSWGELCFQKKRCLKDYQRLYPLQEKKSYILYKLLFVINVEKFQLN